MFNFRRGLFLFLALIFAALPVFAQDTKARIYVSSPQGGSAGQRAFFEEQFKMEVAGTGYPLVERKDQSDYVFQTNIELNPDYRPNRGEERYFLVISMVNSKTAEEAVQFSFAFTELETMYKWNPFLVYQALVNTPLIPEQGEAALPAEAEIEAVPPVLSDSVWSRKWLYLNIGVGVDMGYLLRPGTMVTEQGIVMPTALFGVEFYPLDFLALEVDPFKLRFLHDGTEYFLSSYAAAQVKGFFRVSHFLLEPYGGMEFLLPFEFLNGDKGPWLWALAGFQLGFPRGKQEVIYIDFSLTYGMLGELALTTEMSRTAMRFNLTAGFKFGFINRKE